MKTKCIQCGNEFSTNNKLKKTCDKECYKLRKKKTDRERYLRNRRNMKTKCIICGTMFDGDDDHRRSLCSEACRNINRKKQREQERKKYRKLHGIKIVINCLQCGKFFRRTNCRKKLCSNECYNKRHAVTSLKWHREHVNNEKECKRCGEIFIRIEGRATRCEKCLYKIKQEMEEKLKRNYVQCGDIFDAKRGRLRCRECAKITGKLDGKEIECFNCKDTFMAEDGIGKKYCGSKCRDIHRGHLAWKHWQYRKSQR